MDNQPPYIDEMQQMEAEKTAAHFRQEHGYLLPRSGGRDFVSEIIARRLAAKRKQTPSACTGFNSCDCRLCRSR